MKDVNIVEKAIILNDKFQECSILKEIKLKIIEYFTTEKKEHWLNEIKKCDWGAGQYLYQLLCENNLKKMVGETALVPMLVEGDRLIAFWGKNWNLLLEMIWYIETKH